MVWVLSPVGTTSPPQSGQHAGSGAASLRSGIRSGTARCAILGRCRRRPAKPIALTDRIWGMVECAMFQPADRSWLASTVAVSLPSETTGLTPSVEMQRATAEFPILRTSVQATGAGWPLDRRRLSHRRLVSARSGFARAGMMDRVMETPFTWLGGDRIVPSTRPPPRPGPVCRCVARPLFTGAR